MAAFKTLNSQDIIISPLEVEKNFSYKGNALTASNVGIIRYKGAKFNHSISKMALFIFLIMPGPSYIQPV